MSEMITDRAGQDRSARTYLARRRFLAEHREPTLNTTVCPEHGAGINERCVPGARSAEAQCDARRAALAEARAVRLAAARDAGRRAAEESGG